MYEISINFSWRLLLLPFLSPHALFPMPSSSYFPRLSLLSLLTRPQLFRRPLSSIRLFHLSYNTTATLSFFHPPHTHTHTHTRTFTPAIKHHHNNITTTYNNNNKKTMANSAAAPTLPGFLRPEANTSRDYFQKAFETIENQEVERLDMAYDEPNSPFSLHHATHPTARDLNRCKLCATPALFECVHECFFIDARIPHQRVFYINQHVLNLMHDCQADLCLSVSFPIM